MSKLPPALEAVVVELLARSEDSRSVTLDAIGDAIGEKAIDTDQIEEILQRLEAAKRTIAAPEGQRGVGMLKQVIPAARALRKELARTPTVEEIATKTQLAAHDVRHALLLAKVISRA